MPKESVTLQDGQAITLADVCSGNESEGLYQSRADRFNPNAVEIVNQKRTTRSEGLSFNGLHREYGLHVTDTNNGGSLGFWLVVGGAGDDGVASEYIIDDLQLESQ